MFPDGKLAQDRNALTPPVQPQASVFGRSVTAACLIPVSLLRKSLDLAQGELLHRKS